MPSEQTFVPELGHLITRVVINIDGNIEFGLCYRDDEKDATHVRQVARIRWFQAEPYFSGSVECALGAPNLWPHVSYHYSTWEELSAIPRLWVSKVAFSDWLAEICLERGLNDDQKDRLHKTCQPRPE